MIPIHLKLPNAALPELEPGQTRVVLAGDGPYLERRTSMYSTSTKWSGPLLGLENHEERCRLFCGRIPRIIIRTMLGFFQAAFRVHQGEAALVLLYSPQKRTFKWHCPEQTVEVYRSFGKQRSFDDISYEMPLTLPEGYVIFGDAHSHGEMGAFPSGIDKRDEQFKDGLHIIVGRIDRPEKISYHIDFVMDRQRFNFDPDVILEDVHCRPFDNCPKSWLDKIKLKPRSSYFSWSRESNSPRRGY